RYDHEFAHTDGRNRRSRSNERSHHSGRRDCENNDGSEATVEGYIVGYVISPENVTRTDFREDYNVAIADEPGETDIDKMLYVQVSSQYRADFGLATNPENLDKQIIVTGDLEQYHLHNGLKNPSAMNFTSEEPGEPVDL